MKGLRRLRLQYSIRVHICLESSLFVLVYTTACSGLHLVLQPQLAKWLTSKPSISKGRSPRGGRVKHTLSSDRLGFLVH